MIDQLDAMDTSPSGGVLEYALQLRQLYGGDEAVVTVAALLQGAAPQDVRRAALAEADLSPEQAEAVIGILAELDRRDAAPATLEGRILHDAVLLVELRGALRDPTQLDQAQLRLDSLNFPASRQQAARDYALAQMVVEHKRHLPALEALSSQGNYIVLEGIDGAGKNVQAEHLMDRLRAMGREVIFHEEPSPRLAALQAAFGSPSPTLELFLYTADRIERTQQVVLPALQAGKDVVSVRCFVSTLAYQSGDYSPAEIIVLSKLVPMPSLILLLDLPAKLGLSRVAQRQQPKSKYEKQERLIRTRERYREVIQLLPQAVIVDATPPIEAVAEVVWRVVRSQLMLG